MNLLKPAEITLAYFKCGIFGFQGSGKTYTAALIAKGICEITKNKNVAFFDTETGSDFLVPYFKKAKIQVFQVKRRDFTSLLETIKECEESKVNVLIIDSITHVWRDLCDAYDKKLNRKGRLQFQDWATLKGEWKIYTDAFVNSPLHCIVCGRAGYEYDYDYNEDGSKDLIKTGTKMKAEGEFGFEPSLVVEMERISKNRDEVEKIKDNRAKKQAFQPKIGSQWIHRAHILKDRSDTLNGQSFDYPTFEDFKPHFDFLNIGGEHLGVETDKTSEDRFDIEGRPDWKKQQIQKEIALEEIQATMTNLWPSTKADDKKNKADFLEAVFGTRSWTAVTERPLVQLENIKMFLKPFEQKYDATQPITMQWQTVLDVETMKNELKEKDVPI